MSYSKKNAKAKKPQQQYVSSTEDLFKCNSCGKAETMGSYAIAQTAMGHTVTFTCSCGNKIKIVK